MDDNPLCILVILVAIASLTGFLATQHDLCLSNPNEWFLSLVSGVVFTACVWLLVFMNKRE